MAEGFDVLQKQFEFELPVTKQKGALRFATRMDKIIAQQQLGTAKGAEADERLELTYLGRIIVSLGELKGPLGYDQLRNFPEKDLLFLRAFDMKLNSLGEDDFKAVVDSFDKALKS